MPSRSRSRPKKTTSSKSAKKKIKNTTKPIHHSPPTLQLQVHDHNQMEDSSNGKLEETHKVHPEDVVGDSKLVVEAVRDIAIDDYSVPASKTHDGNDSSPSSSSSDDEAEPAQKSPQVVDSGEVEEIVETVVSESNHVDQGEEPPVENSGDSGVVDLQSSGEKEEEILPYETDGSSPAVVEEKTVSYVNESNGVPPVEADVVSNGVEESTLPSLSENYGSAPVTASVVSNGIEETEVPYSDEKEQIPPAVTDEVPKGIEETKLLILEEKTGESSGTAYTVAGENVDDDSLKPYPEVPPVESTHAGEEYGKPEIPETTENPSIISVTTGPLQPTSWKSCCGLFEVLRRSDR